MTKKETVRQGSASRAEDMEEAPGKTDSMG